MNLNMLRLYMLKKTMMVMSLVLLSSVAQAKPATEWTGFYAGLNLGGILNNAHINSQQLGFTTPDGTCNTSTHFSSVTPGLQIGYARQFDANLVLGVEGDYTYNFNHQGNTTCDCETNTFYTDKFAIKNREQGSLRGRFGYALNNHLLPYFMLGGSWANLGIKYSNESSDYYHQNTTHQFGWLVGAGLEWHFSPAFSVRAEYFYTDYTDALNMRIPMTYGLIDPNGHARASIYTSTVRAAINYWF